MAAVYCDSLDKLLRDMFLVSSPHVVGDIWLILVVDCSHLAGRRLPGDISSCAASPAPARAPTWAGSWSPASLCNEAWCDVRVAQVYQFGMFDMVKLL